MRPSPDLDRVRQQLWAELHRAKPEDADALARHARELYRAEIVAALDTHYHVVRA
jgi:hypothetical protein